MSTIVVAETARPEPATLAPAEAWALVRDIRRHARPRVLDELRGLYRSHADASLSHPEVQAAEARLRDLDQYLSGLIRVLGRRGGLGWERFRPRWHELRRDGAAVEAQVDLAFSAENHDCVHGPLTLVPVVDLARHLLAAGEGLGAIERVTWTVPLRHRLALRVWDAASAPRSSFAETALAGRLRTSSGRSLRFAGVPVLDRPLIGQRGYNDLLPALTRGKRLVISESNHLLLELAEEGLAVSRRAVRSRPDLCAALVLDVVAMAIASSRPGRPLMACGYRDVPLATPPATAFAPGTRLELRYRPELSRRSPRSGLWISYYEFRYPHRQTEWSTMGVAEAADVPTMLREIHS